MLTIFVIFAIIKLIMDQIKEDHFFRKYPIEEHEKHFFQPQNDRLWE